LNSDFWNEVRKFEFRKTSLVASFFYHKQLDNAAAYCIYNRLDYINKAN